MARSHRRVRAGAAVLAIALLAATGGCGDDGGGAAGAEAPPPLTKTQLAERMGDICQEHTDRQVVEIRRFEKRHGLGDSSREAVPPAQLERELVVVMLPIVEDTIGDLRRELRPSEQQLPTFEAFLRALEHGVSYSRKDPSWIVGGKVEPFSRARELSWELGTAYCGQA